MTWPQSFRATVAALTLCLSGPLGAVPEAQLEALLQTKILPFFSNQPIEFVDGNSGVQIAFRRFFNGKSNQTVFVVPGYSEVMDKYAEVVFDLFEAGFSVVIFDPRGQGHSDRLSSDPKLAHVDRFDNFSHDLQMVKSKALAGQPLKNLYLLGHSMGGAQALAHTLDFPKDFTAIVLVAPALQLQLPVPTWALSAVTRLLELTSFLNIQKKYIRGPHDPGSFQFSTNRVTGSAIRYHWLQMRTTAELPQTQVWGMSLGWLREMLKGSQALRGKALSLKLPILILQAGEDSFVSNDAQDKLCTQLPNCRLLRFQTAKHEILMEQDQHRETALTAIKDWFRTSPHL